MEGSTLYSKKNLSDSSSDDNDNGNKRIKRNPKDDNKEDAVSLSSSGREMMAFALNKKEESDSSTKSHSNDEDDAVLPKNVKKKARESVDLNVAIEQFHRILPLNVLEKYQQVLGTKKRARLRCKLCHEKTSFFCVKCTNSNYDDIFAICSPLKVPLCNCFYEHVTPLLDQGLMSSPVDLSPYNSFVSPVLNDPRVTEILENRVIMK